MLASISVVIPAYNAEAFLGDAIKSIHAQTLPVLEIIVVDDGSTDRTSSIAASLNTRVIRQANSGASAARNAGIRASTGQWIAFLDADDIWEPEKTECQYEMINLCPDVYIVSCDHCLINNRQVIISSYLSALGNPQRSLKNSHTNKFGIYFPHIADDFFCSKWVLLPSTVMIRHEACHSVGFFNESLRGIEDFEFFMRVISRYPLAVVERPLMRYRLHEKNTHYDLPLMRSNLLKYFELVIANPNRSEFSVL